MRDRSLTSVVKSIVSNLTVIKIVFFVLSILTVTNVVLSVLVVPLIPLLLVLSVGVKVFYHINHVVPVNGVTSIRILMSAWIGWKMRDRIGLTVCILRLSSPSAGVGLKKLKSNYLHRK